MIGDKRKAGEVDFTTFQEALEAVKGLPLHGIIQTELYADELKNREILDYAQTHHISYRFVPGNSELFVGNIDVELFRSSVPVISVHQTALLGWGRVVKRLFDLVVGSFLLLIASPLMLLIAIVNMLSVRKIFFRQARLTRYNESSRYLNFSLSIQNMMAPHLKKHLHSWAVPNSQDLPRQWRSFAKRSTSNSYRQVFCGQLALMKFLNYSTYCRGDISLVGPRALIPQELDVYAKKHTILSVKSGLTGLAQVSGRRNISFEERRKLDLFYVQNWSFWLDIIILFKTIRVVLDRTGAK
jgi:lipopolysaccharide/colanic/teichoic acid biosynthesis glycosyltransferase